jgi:hypothetical protein
MLHGIYLLEEPIKLCRCEQASLIFYKFFYVTLTVNSTCQNGPSEYVRDAKLNMKKILDIQSVIIA